MCATGLSMLASEVHSRASLVAGFTNAAESFVEQLSAEELQSQQPGARGEGRVGQRAGPSFGKAE